MLKGGTGEELLCATCQNHKIRDHLIGSRRSTPVISFPLEDGQQRKDCPFCRLVYGLVSARTQPFETIVDLEVECQIQKAPGQGTTFNISYGKDQGMQITLQKIKPCMREIDDRTHYAGPAMDFTRLRTTLATCMQNHKQCRYRPNYYMMDNILLIDVQRNCIVELPASTERVALSYVWGKDQALKTTTETIEDFQTEYSLLKYREKIPKTVWESMILVRELGQRYLWVGSCSYFTRNALNSFYLLAFRSTAFA